MKKKEGTFSVFPYVNSYAKITAHAEISPCKQPLSFEYTDFRVAGNTVNLNVFRRVQFGLPLVGARAESNLRPANPVRAAT